jgi:predicted GNAT family N-acyltransferase
LTIRVKTVSDEKEYQDALQVRRIVFIEEQNVSEAEEIDEYEHSATHFISYDGDKPVGAGRFRNVDGKGKVERICVLPSYRKEGVGQMIMRAIEKNAGENGFNILKLAAQTHAEHFYLGIGYKTNSDQFYDAGIPHVAMEKKLQ